MELELEEVEEVDWPWALASRGRRTDAWILRAPYSSTYQPWSFTNNHYPMGTRLELTLVLGWIKYARKTNLTV